MIVHTAGHSTLSLEAFVDLLAAHGIRAVADVRRYPASRRHPHFAREAFDAGLAAAGITYLWIPELGGRRPTRPDSPHRAWKVEGFRGYADHLETPEFASGLDRLLALAAAHPTAVVCAEAHHTKCHRRILADALLARGIEVLHTRPNTPPEPHHLPPFARIEGTRLIYDDSTQPTLPNT